jgi:hypothetical protein
MDFSNAYRRMTCLYPKDYQFRFAAEMCRAFDASVCEHRNRGRLTFARFLFLESIGLLREGCCEWKSKWTTDVSIRSLHLPDLRMMPLPWVPQDVRRRLLKKPLNSNCLRSSDGLK